MSDEVLDHTSIDAQQKRSERFGKKIAIWNLEGEKKSAVAEQVIDDLQLGGEYWSQMFLSMVVATLGLLIDATPVVIGAMIIAPILRPIQGIAFATATGNRHVFFRSSWILLVSILVGVCTGVLLTWLLPLTEVTNEISMRIQPTLVDLGIAFASGLVAFLALGREKMAAGLAGVAMAASLVPPLAVIGIGIGFGSMAIARGSMVLFMTNLIAIIIGGIIVFYLFGFYPTQKDDLRRSIRHSVYALVMMILLSIPLASSLITITKNVATNRTITHISTEFFDTIDPSIQLENITIDKVDGTDAISLNLKIPQSILTKLTDTEQQELTTRLSRALKNDVRLDMVVIPFTTITKAAAKESTLTEKITENSKGFISSLYHDTITLLDLNYYTAQQNILVLTLFADTDFDKSSFYNKFQSHIKDLYPQIDKVIINWQHDSTDENIQLTENQLIQADIKDSFTSFFSATSLHKLEITSTDTTMTILIEASTPLDQDIFTQQLSSRRDLISEIYEKKIETRTYINWLEYIK